MTMRLSPIAQRRWQRFRANRRGWWSLWLFVCLFGVTLAGNLLANDKPLLVHMNGHWYFPAFARYTEQQLGGDLPFVPDYRSDYVQRLVKKQGGWMLFAPIRFSYDTVNYDLTVPAPSPPTRENLLGTDDQGRDVLARVIFGMRVSIAFGLMLALASTLIGVLAGAIQGYFGGWVDLIGQRVQDIWSGLPMLYILIILTGFITPNFWWLLGVMALFSWLALVDAVRAEFLRGRSLDYVKAARALGLSDLKIMRRHVFPNALTATVTFAPFMVTGGIAMLSALDFLGFGMPVGSPSLGELTAQSIQNLYAPWLAVSAFVSLALVLSLLVFIGEGLRDAFDPRA